MAARAHMSRLASASIASAGPRGAVRARHESRATPNMNISRFDLISQDKQTRTRCLLACPLGMLLLSEVQGNLKQTRRSLLGGFLVWQPLWLVADRFRHGVLGITSRQPSSSLFVKT